MEREKKRTSRGENVSNQAQKKSKADDIPPEKTHEVAEVEAVAGKHVENEQSSSDLVAKKMKKSK